MPHFSDDKILLSFLLGQASLVQLFFWAHQDPRIGPQGPERKLRPPGLPVARPQGRSYQYLGQGNAQF